MFCQTSIETPKGSLIYGLFGVSLPHFLPHIHSVCRQKLQKHTHRYVPKGAEIEI
jgi:hypothetical protein